jgi:glycyl-tRNA synthetase
MAPSSKANLDTIVALCKRRGFIFQSSEIYGGLNGVYDSGPLGLQLKENLKNVWKKYNNNQCEDIVYIDGALLGPKAMWEASGHLSNFSDPMVDCLTCKHRFRSDDINMQAGCPHCGAKNSWTDVRQFNMMFSTQLGAAADGSSVAYLRPETAQTIYVNFKNVLSAYRMKIPFGIGQIGKAFRNEITPKQFLFRMREFEQMELEWFCLPNQTAHYFDLWRAKRFAFYQTIGINMTNLRIRDHDKDELSHYSSATSDIEYQYPFGWKELEGIAYRGNFDLTQHALHSKKDLAYFDEQEKQSVAPHVVECSVGVDRLFLTVLFDAYDEETITGDNGETDTRVVLRLHPALAPITAAILPLSKKQSEACKKIYAELKKEISTLTWDESGSIGKRYRRYDEVGAPYCITYDFDSENDNAVTIRERDSMKQERVPIDTLATFLKEKMTYRP